MLYTRGDLVFGIEQRSKYYNNPEAEGFIVYGQRHGETVVEFGRGSELDHPFKTREAAELFVEHINC